MADEIIAEIDWSSDVDAEIDLAQTDERKGLPSASEYPRIFHCPGYLNLKRKLTKKKGPATPGPYALSGQRVHAALANPIPQLVSALVGEEENVFDWCRDQFKRLVELHATEAGEDIRERRFFLGEKFSGQIDRALVGATKIIGTDYKAGRIPVEPAESNLQIRAYSVLLDIEFPGRALIIMSIIQPWVSKEPIVVGYGRAELDKARRELEVTLARAEDPLAKRIIGAHCRYCPCRADCEEARQVPQAVAKLDPAVLTSGDQIAAVLDQFPLAKQVIEAVEQEAKRRLAEDPGSIPGYFLKPGRKISTITKPEVVYGRVSKMGVDQPAFMGTVNIGKEKLAAAIKAVTGAKGKALDDMVADVLSGCTTEKQSAPSIAKEVAPS